LSLGMSNKGKTGIVNPWREDPGKDVKHERKVRQAVEGNGVVPAVSVGGRERSRISRNGQPAVKPFWI